MSAKFMTPIYVKIVVKMMRTLFFEASKRISMVWSVSFFIAYFFTEPREYLYE